MLLVIHKESVLVMMVSMNITEFAQDVLLEPSGAQLLINASMFVDKTQPIPKQKENVSAILALVFLTITVNNVLATISLEMDTV